MFKTIAEVKEANKRAGFYFFSKSTMRFFSSRIESSLYKNQCFITSEKACFSDYTRVYSVRQVDSNGNIKTLHSQIQNKDKARELARLG